MRTWLLVSVLAVGVANFLMQLSPPSSDIRLLLALREACVEETKAVGKQTAMVDAQTHAIRYLAMVDQCALYGRASVLLDEERTEKWVKQRNELFWAKLDAERSP